jgi:hypothetical protein
MGRPEVTIDMASVLPKELIIKGSFRYGVSGFATRRIDGGVLTGSLS